jgi:RNA polymerase sigma-70 factor (ECF subfamily)
MNDPRKDDHEARFRGLFTHEFGYVWNTLRRLGVAERELPDVAQEVFITVDTLLADCDMSRPMRPWLFAVAYRVALRHRGLARHRREHLDEEPLRTAVDQRSAPDESVDRARDRQLVHNAIERVEIHRRAVFVLCELDGHTVREVAEALGIPLNTAYSRLRLAREDFMAAVRRLAPSRFRVGASS